MATVIFLTTASTSPWTVPADFTTAGHTIELVSAGHKSGAATTGSSGNGAGAGGGGGYGKGTYSSGTMTPSVTTVKFKVGPQPGGSTVWEETASPVNASYYLNGASQGSGTTGGNGSDGVLNTVTTPAIIYTWSNAAAGGKGGSSGKTLGGGGGGGAGGPSGAGSAGTTATTTAGGQGGAANNGSPAGGAGGAAGNNSVGTAGTAATLWTQTSPSTNAGVGSGGGGSGADTVSEPTTPVPGVGGAYGGGGAGVGYARGTFSPATIQGDGGDGLIVVTYTAAASDVLMAQSIF